MELLGMGLLGWLPLLAVFYIIIAAVFASQLYSDDYNRAIRGLTSMLWPIWVAFVIVSAPFLVVGWLGERLRVLSGGD